MATPLSPDLLSKMDAYWRAANYLSVGQIYLLDNPLLSEPLTHRAHQAAAAGALGHHARAEFHLRSSQSPHQEARSEHDLCLPAPATAGRAWSPTPIWKEPTANSIRTSRKTKTGMKQLFKQFSLSRRHSQPRRARKRPARSTKAANWAIRCSHAYRCGLR